jgi:hypothetical protein
LLLKIERNKNNVVQLVPIVYCLYKKIISINVSISTFFAKYQWKVNNYFPFVLFLCPLYCLFFFYLRLILAPWIICRIWHNEIQWHTPDIHFVWSVSKYVDNDPLLAYGQRERTHVNLSRERQALKACTEVTLTVELSSWFQ